MEEEVPVGVPGGEDENPARVEEVEKTDGRQEERAQDELRGSCKRCRDREERRTHKAVGQVDGARVEVRDNAGLGK